MTRFQCASTVILRRGFFAALTALGLGIIAPSNRLDNITITVEES